MISNIDPEGNRDQKRKLLEAHKYPMKSAIQKNLGGPLSEVFFSCLTPSQQDNIGYTPKLKGPGRDLWVSPSDILIGKVVLSPPFSSRLRQALTHQGIMEMGREIEFKMQREHEIIMERALRQREREMMEEISLRIQTAVQADRKVQELINNQILEKASSDLSASYQEILANTMSQLLEEGVKKLEEALFKTEKEMEQELCQAVMSHAEHLCRQYEFQLAWQETDLTEKYEQSLKKHRQECVVAMNQAQAEFEAKLKSVKAKLEAEHITDLLVQGAERSEEYHEEKKQLEHGFEVWFMKYFDDEIVERDFSILEMEDKMRKLAVKCGKREEQLMAIFCHFQKFINFALKEKPGQAEFLLSLQKELDNSKHKVTEECEEERIAKTILEYILKVVDDHSNSENIIQKEKGKLVQVFNKEDFRKHLRKEREKEEILRVVGEEKKSTMTESKFRMDQMMSLANMFQQSPSVLTIFNNILSLSKNQTPCKDTPNYHC